MDTSERIKNIISALNLNNNTFAKHIGVANTTIDGYIKGRKNSKGEKIISQPNYDVIKKIVEKFDINANYILGLSDEIFVDNKNILIGNLETIEEYTNASIEIHKNIDKFKEIPIFKNLIDIEALKLVLSAKEGDNINIEKL
jgi:transcriptional regulator with XRE-family HTH domain